MTIVVSSSSRAVNPEELDEMYVMVSSPRRITDPWFQVVPTDSETFYKK